MPDTTITTTTTTAAKADEPLPSPWIKQWSPSHEAYFYVNPSMTPPTRQWEFPKPAVVVEGEFAPPDGAAPATSQPSAPPKYDEEVKVDAKVEERAVVDEKAAIEDVKVVEEVKVKPAPATTDRGLGTLLGLSKPKPDVDPATTDPAAPATDDAAAVQPEEKEHRGLGKLLATGGAGIAAALAAAKISDKFSGKDEPAPPAAGGAPLAPGELAPPPDAKGEKKKKDGLGVGGTLAIGAAAAGGALLLGELLGGHDKKEKHHRPPSPHYPGPFPYNYGPPPPPGYYGYGGGGYGGGGYGGGGGGYGRPYQQQGYYGYPQQQQQQQQYYGGGGYGGGGGGHYREDSGPGVGTLIGGLAAAGAGYAAYNHFKGKKEGKKDEQAGLGGGEERKAEGGAPPS